MPAVHFRILSKFCWGPLFCFSVITFVENRMTGFPMQRVAFQLYTFMKHQPPKKLGLLAGFLLLSVLGFTVHFCSYPSFLGGNPRMPRKNIVFLKTHKCASSTIQNVLLRYGESRNLTFVLPTTLNYLGHPAPFNRMFVPYPTEKMEFNILAHHSRFNYQEMRLLMPEDTAFITIVRNPSDLVESIFNYYRLDDIFETDLEGLVQNDSLARDFTYKRYYKRIGFNQMSFDLGLDANDFFIEKVVLRFCRLLDEQFDLVMVAERVDESLILLMDLMGWTLDDVMAFRLNARKSSYKSKLSSDGLRHLRGWDMADQIIYEYFQQRFEERVNNYGRAKMDIALSRFRQKQQGLYESCVIDAKDKDTTESALKDNETISFFEKQHIVLYRLKKSASIQCQRMFLPELQYTKILFEKQLRLIPNYKPTTLAKTHPKSVAKKRKKTPVRKTGGSR